MPFPCPSRRAPSTASSPVTSTAISRRENDDASLQRPDGWRRSSSSSPPFAVRMTRLSGGRSVNSRTARTGGCTSGCSRARILRTSSVASFCSRAAGSSSHALDAPAFVLPLSGLAATRPSRLPRLCRSRLSARILAGRERAPRPAGVHVRARARRRRGGGAPPVPRPRTSLGQRRAPVYDLPEQAVTAIAQAAGYARWRATPAGHQPNLPHVDSGAARFIEDEAVGAGGGWQSPDRAAALLSAYGITVASGQPVVGADAAAAAAERIGYPVVVKAADPNLVHKPDQGGVALNLTPAEAVRGAYASIARALGAEPVVLVQPMLAPGLELVAGIVHDPVFGSLVMLGLGGVHTDIFADRALRLLPVPDLDAAA